MIRERADVLILGAGFTGSLMALVAERIGLRVVLVDKGSHPRFAIGESSTPVANLVLEQLSHTYNLPRLLPLTKFGRWQAAYPQMAVGLKRGFTFIRHESGKPFEPRADHSNELLVAANPNDALGDTHWFREEFDHFILNEVRATNIPYYDRTEIASLEHRDGWHIHGQRLGEEIAVDAKFLIDATGPSGLLPRVLGIETASTAVRTNSWSVFSHFTNVDWWQDILIERGASMADHPYPCDHAALHHVLDDGWLWVLRFNNGVTSAGIMFDGERRPPDTRLPPAAEWAKILRRYPSVGRQFAKAKPVQPWARTGRIQRKARVTAGEDWAMLAHAAYFLDPMFSSGNAHSLLTIERLGRMLARHWGKRSLQEELAAYDAALSREIDFVDRLIHGCYRSFRRFDLLAPFTMYYFAGAIRSEERRMLGLANERDEFLFSHEPQFREAFECGYERLLQIPDTGEFTQQVARDISHINTAGLCDSAKNNMYHYV